MIRPLWPLPPVREEPSHTPWTEAALCTSDLHLGLWRDRHAAFPRQHKAAAFAAMVRYAIDNGATRFVLNGDILDDRAGKRAVKKESRLVREAMAEYHSVGAVLMVRGNHDRGSTKSRIRKRLGPCRIESGVVHLPTCGLVVAHGHILDAHRSKRLIASFAGMSRRQWKQLNRSLLRDTLLQEELAEIDRLGESLVRIEKIQRLRHAFEVTECALRSMRTRLADVLRRLSPRTARRLHIWADGLDLRSLHRAGQLAGVLGGWATVYGHNHTPGLYRREVVDPTTRQLTEVLVGNSGSFIQHRQPITCIFAKYPTLTLLAYDLASGRLVPIQSLTRTGGEAIGGRIGGDIAEPLTA